MGNDKHGEMEPKNHPPPTKDPGVASSNAKSTASTAGSTKRIAAAPLAEFGDQLVEETAFQNVSIFNQDPDLAFLSAQIEGSSAFQIVSKPAHVNPTSSGFDPNAAIRVAYSSRTRTVDKGFLLVTLQWRDGSSESIRVALQGAAHGSGELTHADENAQTSAKQDRRQQDQQRQKAADTEEARIRALEAKGGSDDHRITNAAGRLAGRLTTLGTKQQNGVTEAAALVAAYKRKMPAPPPPDLVAEFAKLALTLASGGISSRLTAAIGALIPSTGAGWTPSAAATPRVHDYGGLIDVPAQPGTPGTKEVSESPVGAIVGVIASKLIGMGTAKLMPTAPSPSEGETDAAEDQGKQLEYFSMQRDMVAKRLESWQDNAIDIKRSLIQFDNPRDAGKAADILEQSASVVTSQAEAALSLQATESTKGWIRLLSQTSLGSVSAVKADAQGLKETKDGSSTAKIDQAVASKPYDGVVELEFDADAINAAATVRVSSARLFGISNAAARRLHLSSKPLTSAGLAIRARSSHASSPVDVSIARDEAGNVRYTDDSGAAGMPTPWLSRRGGRSGSESTAQQAAKKLIDELAGKTLTQLGVNLVTDSTDV